MSIPESKNWFVTENLLDMFSRSDHDAKMMANKSENYVGDVKGSLRAFILEYAAGHGVTEVKDDEPLLKNNIIDSLGVFRLIDFLEETFPLTVEDTDMVPEGFDNLNAIEAFVYAKTGMSKAAPEPAPEEQFAAVA